MRVRDENFGVRAGHVRGYLRRCRSRHLPLPVCGGRLREEMSYNLNRKETIMNPGTTRVNSSEETIKIGPLEIRFLVTADDTNGSVSVF
jgi:hypothetical protein